MEEDEKNGFKVGDLVRFRVKPEMIGVVTHIHNDNEGRYDVRYYEDKYHHQFICEAFNFTELELIKEQ